ncbi:MAG: NAD(P)H-hydrate epimerase [Candidatus Omnitrophica bacterium]|nr:NAD(P)H-hydrate epimerase [Candidatus Omnitrophota bacterium]
MRGSARLLTAARSKKLDERAARAYGISTLVLMENAGRQVAEAALRMYRGRAGIAIFCGKGNNGGDGFVAARHLVIRGIRPQVLLAGRIPDVRGEARSNLDILLKLKQRIVEISPEAASCIKVRSCGLIIDALLGIGLTGEVRGIYQDLIAVINGARCRVLSVDIPSGLDATTGKVLGCCVKADTTVTFAAKKRGMTAGAGPRVCGRIVVADIGIPV